MKTYSEDIGNFAEQLKFADLPNDVVQKVKVLFLDTLGICIASSKKDYAKIVIELVKELGGKNRISQRIGRQAGEHDVCLW